MDNSFNDLKFQLQSELQKEGMVESMKTQLRYKLLERLQLQQKKIPTSDKVPEPDMLLRRVLASLVADYLKDTKMEYCLSVFVPESSFGNAILNRDELRLLMKVEQTQASVLQNMIQDILMLRPREPLRTNAATQTLTGDAIMNLEDKLNQVDTLYKTRIEGELQKPYIDMEERLQKLKREYDLRLKTELAAEVTRIREFEIQNVKLEESDKYRMKMQAYREELEKNYQDKLNKLRERERDSLEKAGQKMKELETLNYQYRQKILKEHEYIKLKEEELEKQKQANEQALKMQQTKLEVLDREISKKTKEVGDQELQMKRILEQQVHAARIDAENQFYEEREQIKQKQKMMEGDLLKLEQMKITISTLQRENKQLSDENAQYVETIRDLKRSGKTIEKDFQDMRDQLRALTDANRREQEMTRRYETDLKLREDEIQLLRVTISHKEGMINDHKILHQETVKKMQRELDTFQKKVETQELLIKDLQMIKENHNPNFKIDSDFFKANVVDSTIIAYNMADHKNRLDQIQRELVDNRNKRKEEIKRLQQDLPVQPSEPQMKFDNVWDNYNSSVNFQQEQPSFVNKSKFYDDPHNKFQEDAQSQVIQSGLQQQFSPVQEDSEELL